MRLIKRAIRWAGEHYVRETARRLYEERRPDPRGPNERPLEYAFALRALSHSEFQDVVDVGTGTSAWPSIVAGCGYAVSAVDEMGGYWGGRYGNRHCYVKKHDITVAPLPEKSGIITCISTLEHIREHEHAVVNMSHSLKPGGILIITCAYNEGIYHPNIYSHPDAGYGKDVPYIAQVFNRHAVNRWLAAAGLALVEQRYWACFTGEMWTFGQRLRPMREVSVSERHHLTGVVLRSS